VSVVRGIIHVALGALLLAVSFPAAAQQPKLYRVGVILPGSHWSEIISGFRAGLQELGLEEGKQFVLDIRDSKGDLKAAEEAAKSLEREKVDLIYTTRTSVTIAAKRVTADIPIVFSAGADPVVLRLVESFAKPGGRLTGVYEPGTDLTAKRLEILNEIVPKLRRVLAFYDPRNPVASESARLLREEVARLGAVEFVERHFASVEELKARIRSVKAKEVDAFFQLSDSMVNSQAELIIETARVNRLPTMFLDESSVVKGGLASYAVSFHELGRLSAKYVQRALSGVKPRDLPVEAVRKIDLVINLNTAKQIGLTIPPNVLARADKVIK
jgi:putative ABC transport system substrate-binding protein